jgi:membrane associated rhomboid family serine protease
MFAADEPSDPDQPLENLAEAGLYASAADCSQHGLVVLAIGLPYWLVEDAMGYHLFVEAQHLPAVLKQLAYFDRESIGWPPRQPVELGVLQKLPLFTPLLWALAVVTVFHFQNLWPSVLENAGAMDHRAIDQAELWRPFTALFLHADSAHLTSNLLAGFFTFATVLSAFGRLRGWLFLAIASVAGNLIVAMLNQSEQHRSLGASTAVFAGLGLLAGRAVRVAQRTTSPHRWRAIFVPLAAGLTLLGLFGAGEPHTDVGAHGAGFLAGLVLGFIAQAFTVKR